MVYRPLKSRLSSSDYNEPTIYYLLEIFRFVDFSWKRKTYKYMTTTTTTTTIKPHSRGDDGEVLYVYAHVEQEASVQDCQNNVRIKCRCFVDSGL